MNPNFNRTLNHIYLQTRINGSSITRTQLNCSKASSNESIDRWCHSVSPIFAFATSVVMQELNLLKSDIRDFKSILSTLSCTKASDTPA